MHEKPDPFEVGSFAVGLKPSSHQRQREQRNQGRIANGAGNRGDVDLVLKPQHKGHRTAGACGNQQGGAGPGWVGQRCRAAEQQPGQQGMSDNFQADD